MLRIRELSWKHQDFNWKFGKCREERSCRGKLYIADFMFVVILVLYSYTI